MESAKTILVIRNNKTNLYVDIDSHSGGYPYDTELSRAKRWKSKEEADDYYKHFKDDDWSLCIVKVITSVELTKIDW